MKPLTRAQHIKSWTIEIQTQQQILTDLRDRMREGDASAALHQHAERCIEQQEHLTLVRRIKGRLELASNAQSELENLKKGLEHQILTWAPAKGTNPLSRTIAEAELAALKAALKRLPESFAEEVQP
jgi:hypothetical protein